jgi:hypothetical protein
MKKTALLALFFVTAACPVMAHQHKDYRHHQHKAYLHHHAYRHPDNFGTRSHISCETVRSYVAQMGLEQARAMAQSAGMTASEERRARRCLADRV